MESVIVTGCATGYGSGRACNTQRRMHRGFDIFARRQDRSRSLPEGWEKKKRALQAEGTAGRKVGSTEEYGTVREWPCMWLKLGTECPEIRLGDTWEQHCILFALRSSHGVLRAAHSQPRE